MSYQDQSYLEEVEIAEQDYKDDLDAMNKADKAFQDAYDWHRRTIENANASAKRLSTLKSRD